MVSHTIGFLASDGAGTIDSLNLSALLPLSGHNCRIHAAALLHQLQHDVQTVGCGTIKGSGVLRTILLGNLSHQSIENIRVLFLVCLTGGGAQSKCVVAGISTGILHQSGGSLALSTGAYHVTA